MKNILVVITSGIIAILFSGSVAAQSADALVCSQWDEGYLVGNDWDGDEVLDGEDLCEQYYDPNNDDYDGDGIGDVCDNCPLVPNVERNDLDLDGIGDACDDDIDGDLVLNPRGYVPPSDAESQDSDSDIDTSSDSATDDSDDSDTALDTETATEDSDEGGEYSAGTNFDNCPMAFNPDQNDLDGDGLGDACDPDIDADGAENDADFCPFDRNVATHVVELGSYYGTVECAGDPDGDGHTSYQVVDGVLLPNDNCPFIANDQSDIDGDRIGDDCDPDADGDSVPDSRDNCTKEALWSVINDFNTLLGSDTDNTIFPAGTASVAMLDWSSEQWLGYVSNTDQIDIDKDRVGDQCDLDFERITETGYAFDNCYVVLDDLENCLKVEDTALQVYSPAVLAAKNGDDPVRLRIFANQPSWTLSYSWTLVSGDPDGIELSHARGVVNCSNAYEYHYPVKVTWTENGGSVDTGSPEEDSTGSTDTGTDSATDSDTSTDADTVAPADSDSFVDSDTGGAASVTQTPEIEDLSAMYETRLAGDYTLR
ncbi:MAG: thrombospondin type 3 repeat-containing protein, partial [Deltaproteobacteria bacterium]|nr:thrombospondin type 3 repeat-containing protein [Deltaproteobacteria bacterium]